MSAECAALVPIGDDAPQVARRQPSEVPLLVAIDDLSSMLKRSVASLRRDELAGRLPAALRLGRSKRWCLDEIRAWIKAGAPGRRAWETLHSASLSQVQVVKQAGS